MTREPKTLIGVLASHDSTEKNEALARVFDSALSTKRGQAILKQFGFVFTGGTYARLFDGQPAYGQRGKVYHELKPATKNFLLKECGVIRLPTTDRGGVTILASLITKRMINIIWSFFSPLTTHLLFPENLALLRLADQWRVKKLMNTGSVQEWLQGEAERDARLNPQELTLRIDLPGSNIQLKSMPGTSGYYSLAPVESTENIFPDFIRAKANGSLDRELEKAILALISHDEMKSRMLDFVTDYEHELGKFKHILATGTTGRLAGEAAPSLAGKIHRYHSGPKGGDVEIATEILFGGCHVVIFFVDPLHPHPHTEDIRVVFGACMIQDQVRMLSNEIQARHWMDRMIRGT